MQTLAVDAFDTPLLGRMHQITLPTPFPVGPVHAYLMEGEPLTLIDTGPATADAQKALQAGLQKLGYSFSDLERIIITHAHSDHFGLVGRLVEASGAQVWAHALARPVVEGLPELRSWRDPFWHEFLHASGVPEVEAEQSSRLYRSLARVQTHTPVDGLLQEGQAVEMAGASWQVLYCPGHASNLVCFYDPDSRLLIGNDHLLSHISSNAIVEPPPLGESVRRKPLLDYWQSLCRVHDMEVALVLTGHGREVINHRSLIRSRLAFYEQRLERIRLELRAGPRTVWQLAAALFRRPDAVDTFLAASEVVGHLDVLGEKADVRMETDSMGVWQYYLLP